MLFKFRPEYSSFNRGCFIADEAAIKQTWEAMGASGLRLRLFCRNVVKASSQLHVTDASGWFVSHAEDDLSTLHLQNDARLWATAKDLARHRHVLSQAAFQKRQTSLGMRYAPHGVLFDGTLESEVFPISWTMFDWMHNFLVSGIFQVEEFALRCPQGPWISALANVHFGADLCMMSRKGVYLCLYIYIYILCIN